MAALALLSNLSPIMARFHALTLRWDSGSFSELNQDVEVSFSVYKPHLHQTHIQSVKQPDPKRVSLVRTHGFLKGNFAVNSSLDLGSDCSSFEARSALSF